MYLLAFILSISTYFVKVKYKKVIGLSSIFLTLFYVLRKYLFYSPFLRPFFSLTIFYYLYKWSPVLILYDIIRPDSYYQILLTDVDPVFLIINMLQVLIAYFGIIVKPFFSYQTINDKLSSNKSVLDEKSSYFDGGLLQLIGWKFLGILITVLSLGLLFPLAFCFHYSWEVKHTVLCGKRLSFKGKPISLLGLWLKWLILTIITVGIYSFWIPISLKKWKTENTFFE